MNSMTRAQKIIIGVLAAIAVIAVGVLFAVLLFSSRSAPPAQPAEPATATLPPTATATETLAPTFTAEVTPIDPVWEKIKQNGKMVVGMSADYPPFAYIDSNFQIQGYDLALIQEIGRRLGLTLEIKNMAFDGLFNALQLNEIDVAVAAISVTAERDQIIDFSNVYFVGEDAVLAHRDSGVVIGRVEDMAAYRIGVLRGTVYETWLFDMLVKPGLMPPQDLVLFTTMDEAIQALVSTDPSVELVMLDALPAEVATREAAVKIVAGNLNPQAFALAIPQGAVILQSNLNEILGQMQNDGTLGKLALDYLNLDKIAPLPTPGPTQPPATPEACLDGLALVEHLNYPDFAMTQPPQFQPGVTFQKGWRIQNTGTCAWDSNYLFTYVGSNPANSPVGGNPVAIQGVVQPGETYDIYVTLTTPLVNGRYQSFWTLRNPSGTYFGERVYAGFEVIGQAATQPPLAPIIYSFIASPSQIVFGNCLQLSWDFSGQDLVYRRIFRNGQLLLFDLPFAGSYTECPPITENIEYRLVIDSASHGSASAVQYVYVAPVNQATATPGPTQPQPPVIDTFQADKELIELG